MPDLHVVSLLYKLVHNDSVSYVNPPAVQFEDDNALYRLDDGTLTCEMKVHFSNSEDAQKAVAPTLRAWEVDADLRVGRGELRFQFAGADVIDRAPANSNQVFGVGSAVVASVCAAGTISVHVTRRNYPSPPIGFRLTLDAESVLLRYEGYLDHREPLPAMAYFCLTVLETNAGGREAAASQYGIDVAVLRKIGELTSTRGDALTARKADAAKPLTGAECSWLEAAIIKVIWRLGDTRGAAGVASITMSDLPSL